MGTGQSYDGQYLIPVCPVVASVLGEQQVQPVAECVLAEVFFCCRFHVCGHACPSCLNGKRVYCANLVRQSDVIVL